MTQRSQLGSAALVALAVLFIGLTILFQQVLRGWRIDLTENRLYTIAPGTERILESLREPINLYFFFTPRATDQYPSLRTYGTRVQEFLEELAARSDGKLRLNVIDPQPFSEEEDRAAELGVRPVPIGSTGTQLYFGLAGTNSTDGRAAIEFFDPAKEEFLEYDVAKLIYQLANPKKPVVGLLSGLQITAGFDPMSGQMREPWIVAAQAQQLFTVRQLDARTLKRVDPEIDVLMLVHPKDLPPAAQFAIDQFALRGGRILAFVDPIAEADTSGADPGNPLSAMFADKSSKPGKLFETWGIEFDPKSVVADAQYGLTVSMSASSPPVRHLGILGLDAASLDQSDVVTSGLSNVNLATAGYLRPKKDAGIEFTPLLQSSTQAAILPADRFTMLSDPSTLRDGFQPTGERYTIAARVTGKVKTAFPDGPPEGVELPEGEKPLTESVEPLNLIVFADTDVLADYLWVRHSSFFGQRVAHAWASNGDLVLNALDNLAGSTDLISVRGRATFTRPFERVEALRRNAEARFRAKEKELEEELRATEEKLTQLESQRSSDQGALILTAEQQKEIERFQQEKLRIRKELRDVRLGLDQDIRRLGNTLKATNIVVVPAVYALVALGIGFWRRRRRLAQERPATSGEVAA
ncbi:MAG: Gldg family protein [Pseudomonadota bacterium]|jgi:ABC-type uncharacterized transport system involved in gliding motility, auxiliary component|nr:MAG: hypothetical protein DIU56_12680 [Pseudomonadota bacterium]